MTHYEKDFTDYLEEAILKIDGAIEQQLSCIKELARAGGETACKLRQTSLCEAHIFGLEQAKNILLGK